MKNLILLLILLSTIGVKAQDSNIEGSWVYTDPEGGTVTMVFHDNATYDYKNSCVFYGDNVGMVCFSGNWSLSGDNVELSRGFFNQDSSEEDVEKYCGEKSVPPHTLILNVTRTKLIIGQRTYIKLQND